MKFEDFRLNQDRGQLLVCEYTFSGVLLTEVNDVRLFQVVSMADDCFSCLASNSKISVILIAVVGEGFCFSFEGRTGVMM